MALPAVAAMASNMTAADPLGNIFDLSLGGKLWYSIRLLFYLFTPSDSSYEKLEQVPSYLMQLSMFMPFYMFCELVMLKIQRKKPPRWNDALISTSCIALLLIPLGVIGNVEIKLYQYIWENYRLVDLPWNSPFTWICGLLFADLGLYTWHRAAHEINLIWAFHQVHHTPEDFNLFTGIRLPTFNRQVAMLFYLPGAFFVPPSVFYVHYQLNYLFQLWIHTDCVPCLGAIEYIINTPSLHRVHHGRNRYCIDKNYGGLLMIWDVMLGTYEKERPGVEISYGLVHPIRSWDNVYIQFHHLRYMVSKIREYDNIGDKLSVLFKGPGWAPGTPRLGNYEEIPEFPDDTTKYDKSAPLWVNLYCALQLMLFLVIFAKLRTITAMYSVTMGWGVAGFIGVSMANIGFMQENKRWAPALETLRCVMYFVIEFLIYDYMATIPTQRAVFRTIYALSIVLWYSNLDVFFGKKPQHAD